MPFDLKIVQSCTETHDIWKTISTCILYLCRMFSVSIGRIRDYFRREQHSIIWLLTEEIISATPLHLYDHCYSVCEVSMHSCTAARYRYCIGYCVVCTHHYYLSKSKKKKKTIKNTRCSDCDDAPQTVFYGLRKKKTTTIVLTGI